MTATTTTRPTPEQVQDAQLATVREIDGAFYVYWGAQPLCEKPECSELCALQTCAWLNGLPASEFRTFVECSR